MSATEPPGHDWNASAYDELPLPHERWGAALLGRLALSGDEHVLDAGCGTGRDTALLLERLPRGHVTAVDASDAMLTRLRNRLAGMTERLTVRQADLRSPLNLVRPVAAVISVATLHWVPDHALVFQNFTAAMEPGAQLALECGGCGNIAACSPRCTERHATTARRSAGTSPTRSRPSASWSRAGSSTSTSGCGRTRRVSNPVRCSATT